ncbi:putative alcohol dehydrogenase [Oceaniovalibus guishaninsula JLT2003]|uniref:Putative alcohol dehydrogenase n=1 Tax=Oceaniovalibus guishaninsula JLT2003 TaxID=1231392 RepID=K2I4S7_9RHOB|nr:NADPH:quinone oxidoreductase family protein [Oceaniovalibus guishaninsula]EKE43925.1 putative alcohol dehydrogenase [Oceaniovalibus guishaninsula JLT2003]
MRAFRLTETGMPPALAEIPAPSPGPGQIAVRIAACGLNFADLLMAKGQYQDQPDLPFTMGMELAGTVTALGAGVAGPAFGSRVAVFSGQGGLAEQGVFDADRAVVLPDSMPFEQAAAFLVAYGTSHLALARRGRLTRGERLVVLGAAGGVGLTAVEIGARLGAEVIAVARGADKLDIARQAGARHLLDSAAMDGDGLRDALRGLGGADVVYDAVGGDLGAAALRALRPEGRHLLIGFASGDLPRLAANHLLVKNVDAIGFYWGGYAGFAPGVMRDSLAALLDWYGQGGLRPHVSHVLPLERTAEGLDMLHRRASTGKVVIRCDGGGHIAS